MGKRAFASIDLPPRGQKPREKGITMVIDWGMGLTQQNDLMEMAAPTTDLAKIAVGIPGLLEESYLSRKLEAYKKFDVAPFPGGMFLEYAVKQGKGDAYMEDAVRAGFTHIEVSDNAIPIPKEDLIRSAVNDHGLVVLGEVGSKREGTPANILVEDAERCLEAGSWKVFVEAAEFFVEGEFNQDLASEFTSKIPEEKFIFELPGPWIPEIHLDTIMKMQAWLLQAYGPEANIANVLPDHLMYVETLRRGVGVTLK